MDTQYLILIGLIVGIVINIGTIVGFFIKIQVKLKELEMNDRAQDAEVNNLRSSFHAHEAINEKSFDKLDANFKGIYEKLDNLLNLIINNKSK